MADYASNIPISGPRKVNWKLTWDIGGMGWSHDWGMFYAISDTDESVQLRRPDFPDW